jgi:hypothetical protein
MPVVINEFEVVPQSETSTPPEAEQSGSSAPSGGLNAKDVEKIIERNHERMLRIWAH